MAYVVESEIRASEKSSPISELWYTRCPVPTASGLALDLGWLAKEFGRSGIGLSSLRDSVDPDIRISHFSHRLPGLFREGGNIPAIWARASGQDTVVVALTWVDEYQAILTRPDSGIKTPADLRDRRVGLPLQHGRRVDFARAMALHGIVSALQLGGLSSNNVKLVDIEGEQVDLRAKVDNGRFHNAEVQALLSGRVDAIYVKGAAGRGSAREYGLVSVVDLAEHPDPLVRVNNGNPRPVTVDRRTAAERPDLVARYLSVLISAAEWAKSHPDEVVSIVADEVGRSQDDVRQGYGPNLHQSFGLDLSPLRRRCLGSQKDFLLRQGFLPSDFDIETWFDPHPLERALASAGA